MLFKLLACILFISSHIILCQDKWNPKNLLNRQCEHIDTTFTIQINESMLPFYFNYKEYYEPYEDYPTIGSTHFRVEIKKTYISKPFQVIESESETYYGPTLYDYGYNESTLQDMAIDINFDGYKDLRYKIMEGANAYTVNQTYEYYLYNPLSSRFEIYEYLSNVTNPTPYPDEQRVYGYHRMAFAGTRGYVEIYKWDEDTLKILEVSSYQVEDDCKGLYWEDTCCCKYSRFVDYYLNDTTIIKTDSSLVEIKDIPKRHLLYW